MKFAIAIVSAVLMATQASAYKINNMKHLKPEHMGVPEEIQAQYDLQQFEDAVKEEYPEEYAKVVSHLKLGNVEEDMAVSEDDEDIHSADEDFEDSEDFTSEEVSDEEEVVEEESLEAGVHQKVVVAGVKHSVDTPELKAGKPNKKEHEDQEEENQQEEESFDEDAIEEEDAEESLEAGVHQKVVVAGVKHSVDLDDKVEEEELDEEVVEEESLEAGVHQKVVVAGVKHSVDLEKEVEAEEVVAEEPLEAGVHQKVVVAGVKHSI